MSAASALPCSSIFALMSDTETFPFASQSITTTFIPAITADAAFVPWALDGIRQILRS